MGVQKLLKERAMKNFCQSKITGYFNANKLKKLINKFYFNRTSTDFLRDHSIPFYNSNMMLCGAYRLTLHRHKHSTHPAPQKACVC